MTSDENGSDILIGLNPACLSLGIESQDCSKSLLRLQVRYHHHIYQVVGLVAETPPVSLSVCGPITVHRGSLIMRHDMSLDFSGSREACLRR